MKYFCMKKNARMGEVVGQGDTLEAAVADYTSAESEYPDLTEMQFFRGVEIKVQLVGVETQVTKSATPKKSPFPGGTAKKA